MALAATTMPSRQLAPERAKPRQGARHMKLSLAIAKFLEDHQKIEGRSELTIRNYAVDLGALQAVVVYEAADKVAAFTRDTVRAFFRKQEDKGMAASTILRRKSTLNEFARWCIRQRHLVDNPMVDAPRRKRPKRVPRPYSLEERQRLLALDLPPSEAALRGTLFYAGLRINEAVTLRWKNVRLSSAEQRGALRILGKGNKERIVPMFKELDAILRAWVQTEGSQRRVMNGGYVFEHKGDTLRMRRAQHIVEHWGELAEVEPSTAHRWRHSCCTWLFEQGMDVRFIQKFMGHESIATTMQYTQVRDDAMDQAMAKVEQRLSAEIIHLPSPLEANVAES